MEFNAAITEAEDGFDIPTLIDISSKDLRMCPEKIGSGSLNDVYRGQLIPTPQQTCSCNMDMYAVKKIVRDSSILPALFAVKHIKAATEVLQRDKARGDWFVKLVGASADERCFYLVQEDMTGGDLRNYMDELWSEGDAKILGQQLFMRMQFMHENKLMHLDLKPGVIYPSFKDGTIQFKISDLGVTKRIAFDTTWPLELKKITPGRPRERAYIAAELYEFNGDTRVFTDRIDSWSVGCILYRVITGADIFPNLLTMVKYFNSGQPSPRDGLKAKDLSETGILFIENLLHKNPQHRLSATDALKHRWLETEEAHQPSEGLKEKLRMAIHKNTQNYMACVAPECDMHREVCPLVPGNHWMFPKMPDDSVPDKQVDPGSSPGSAAPPIPESPKDHTSWSWFSSIASGLRSFFRRQ